MNIELYVYWIVTEIVTVAILAQARTPYCSSEVLKNGEVQ